MRRAQNEFPFPAPRALCRATSRAHLCARCGPPARADVSRFKKIPGAMGGYHVSQMVIQRKKAMPAVQHRWEHASPELLSSIGHWWGRVVPGRPCPEPQGVCCRQLDARRDVDKRLLNLSPL